MIVKSGPIVNKGLSYSLNQEIIKGTSTSNFTQDIGHPADNVVCTLNDGYKKIDSLNPAKDGLIAYEKYRRKVYYRQKEGGFSFAISSNFYDGYVHNIFCNGRKITAAPGQKWLVKWRPEEKNPKWYVVYLMKKGPWFRVGRCQLFRVDGCFHPGVRSRQEKADAIWIIRATRDKKDAVMFENLYSAVYGISQVTFRGFSVESNCYYTPDFIKKFFGTLDEKEQYHRASVLLADNYLNIRYPFWTKLKAAHQRGGKFIMPLESCNLLPELMMILFHDGRKVTWTPIDKIICSEYSGHIYALDVEKYRTYLTNGLVTLAAHKLKGKAY